MIKVIIGNIFESKMKTHVNTVNCVGVMGKGIALEFKKKYPEMFVEYKELCDNKKIYPGVPYLYKDLLGTSIINFPTKNHWRSPSKLDDIINGLEQFSNKYKEWGIESVAFPPLGCGNGGLEWSLVGPIMYSYLSKLDGLDVEIYAPYGTKKEQLSSEFLNVKKEQIQKNVKGRIKTKFNENWVVILEVMNILSRQKYSIPIGRTIFQKICYTLTELGVDTGFTFEQASYGPFSQEVNLAIGNLANSNLLIERNLGKMTAVSIGSEFQNYRKEFKSIIDDNEWRIMKTVDLFSRIKNTKQAEEISTIIFSVVRLKQERGKDISEQDVFDFILNWKNYWRTKEKEESVAESIRNLGMLKWINVGFSESLPVYDPF